MGNEMNMPRLRRSQWQTLAGFLHKATLPCDTSQEFFVSQIQKGKKIPENFIQMRVNN
jgi:hypothetical protein